jgi:ADP-L-glycero-D-manno-heptose 6-epimerase
MIIITGGAGFIGSALLWKLNSHSLTDILVVDRMGSGPKWKNLVKRRVSDIIHKDAFLSWLDTEGSRSDIEAIFHMGASSATTETDVDYLVANNLNYTKRLWRYCAAYEVPFIYASSGATYGAGTQGFSDDPSKTPHLRPLNPYGFSKQQFDDWALRQTDAPPFWAGLKFFNVYGPQEYHKGSQSSVIHQWVPQVKQTGAIRLFKSHRPDYADGAQARDFVYVKDVVDVIWHLFRNRSQARSGIYNVGSGRARTFADLARAVFTAMDLPPRLEFIDMPEALRAQYQYHTEAPLQRLRDLGGYTTPMHTLEGGVQDYVRSYLLAEDPYL